MRKTGTLLERLRSVEKDNSYLAKLCAEAALELELRMAACGECQVQIAITEKLNGPL